MLYEDENTKEESYEDEEVKEDFNFGFENADLMPTVSTKS